MNNQLKDVFPLQHQDQQPGKESAMNPLPAYESNDYKAPGPVWTPLIVSSFSPERVATFGSDTPMEHAAQPCGLAPAYVFLACSDSSNITGQVLHVNSGTVVAG